ncbi:TetR/AcrR family transcriptional regulator C-terminal domain-containing protein [Rhizobium mongolense]|uniref:TetR/AcrR family transcriptional regulator C-terminal domain-containing protein n=1 Tax=Rhizobium TaxID=379 RepID=UPI001EF8E26F|nr:TetR/AcrR family transcriptional regulator C-terminal domain-containing protein [Rhizobium gallicum]ULJ70556.1 TetR/AcrR family transcriptional regulator C-terminal domain-containing protein [Rhizobium gallicum]
MLFEDSGSALSETHISDRAMYKSIASLSSADNPRLYKVLFDHFSSLYPAIAKSSVAEFHLGGDQTFRLLRGSKDLTFEVVYSDISRFASITRSLNSRARKYITGFALQWSTSRVAPPRGLLQLPRPLDETRVPEDVLMVIFHLDQADPVEAERKIMACISALYPTGPRLQREAHDYNGQRAIAQLADWLSFQDAKRVLDIEDPDHAATMLISMMFGGMASCMTAGGGLPDRSSLIGYLKGCIHLFVRGCRCKEAA